MLNDYAQQYEETNSKPDESMNIVTRKLMRKKVVSLKTTEVINDYGPLPAYDSKSKTFSLKSSTKNSRKLEKFHLFQDADVFEDFNNLLKQRVIEHDLDNDCATDNEDKAGAIEDCKKEVTKAIK